MSRGWTWAAVVILVGFVILAIWWSVTSSNCENLAFLGKGFPDPTNRMCWCRPLPFQDFHCEMLGLKRVCCDDFDLEGRRCYCCTDDLEQCQKKACSVPY